MCSVSAAVLAAAATGAAHAQDNSTVEEVVVTATRLQASGFTAPTPTTMLGAEQITRAAEPNVFNTIAQLPSLQGSTGVSTGNGGTSGGTNGLSSFNLRGLGTIRTLTLLDGQRVVPANVTGVPDISEFPQLLLSRVDVVTGGASASYGSDAVAGVVNFITDKKFEGFKANLAGGITTYGDDGQATVQLAAGRRFLGGRAHIEASAEYAKEDGIKPNGFGEGPGPDGRTWYVAPSLQIRSIAETPAGQPEITRILHGQDYQFAKFGLITSGPLQGIAFGPGGAPYQFQYGSGGVPLGNGRVSNCVNPFCVGGDNSGAVGNGTSIAGKLIREVFYTRASYDLTDNIELYGTMNIAQVKTSNHPNPGAFKNANLTIQCANPYVPASIQAACVANNITSFQFGTSNAEIPNFISVNPTRNQYRFVGGMDGSFNLFDKKWNFDTYYEHGENRTVIHVNDISLTPRYNAAINAVRGPNGTIVCASPAAQASGCVPFSVIGDVPMSAAALAYIEPHRGPIQHTNQKEDAFSAVVNGTPVDLWAGPLAVAAGAEWRKESYVVRADPYGNGVTADSPYSADYPADPVLNTAGNNWYAGNFHNGQGSYNVWEAFAELGVPLFNNDALGKADLDLAGRHTHYSTSGNVNTWKVGLNWDTPIKGVRLRGVTSKDVRAPNLSELFAAPVVTNGTVINRATGTSVTILNEAIGNTKLAPEKARTTEVGIVLQRTEWLPGFSASIDYFNIKVNGVISSLNAQQEEDLCFAGNAAMCANINLNGTAANPNYVIVQSFNLASLKTDGVDFEASYVAHLGDFGLPGDLTLRGLATWTHDFTTDPGVPGAIPVQGAGVNSGTNQSAAKWKVLGIQSWNTDKWNLTLTERWFSSGVYNNEYIECQTNCPAPTVQHPTIDNNKIPGAFYLDVGGSYNVTNNVTAYFKVANVFNKDPAPIPSTVPNNIGTNPGLYDTLGRMYRIGVRLSY